MDEKREGNAVLPHGDYPMGDGKVHHVLEVQDGFIDVKDITNRIDQRLKEVMEVKHG